MRSRPEIRVTIAPAAPRAGQRLRVDAVLTSKTETPMDALRFELRGTETRAIRKGEYGLPGRVRMAQAEWEHARGSAATPPKLLTPGEHRFSAEFQLPADLPPRYSSRNGSVRYLLEVRADIPWWPDRVERFEIPLVPQAVRAPDAPRLYATRPGGPKGTEPYIEASLDSVALEAGRPFAIAASFSNFGARRVRTVELALIGMEIALGRSVMAPQMVRQHRWKLFDGTPTEGTSRSFDLAVPANVPPSFAGKLMRLEWHLELRAVIAFGIDAVLRIPVRVSSPMQTGPRPTGALPSVGNERRSAVWRTVAEREGLELLDRPERLSGARGAVLLEIACERTASDASMVAKLHWPRLGLALQARPHAWTDAFRDSGLSISPELDAHTIVTGCAPERIRALFSARLAKALLALGKAELDDTGATLTEPGAGYEAAELHRFVHKALVVAEEVDGALATLPPPLGLQPEPDAWRAFARELGGSLCESTSWIEGAHWDGVPLELGPDLAPDGRARALRVRMLFDTGVSQLTDLRAQPESMPPELAAVASSLLEGDEALFLGPGALEAVRPLPDDFRSLAPLLRAMARVARARSAA